MKNMGWALVMVGGLSFCPLVYAAGLSVEQEQQIIRDVLSIYQPESVLAAGEALEFRKCGTSIMVEARRLWPRLSDETRARLSQYLEERPALALYYDTPDGHFRIHYDTTGADAVDLSRGRRTDGVPKYVDTCAYVLHLVWQKEIEDFAYSAPPRDDFYEKGETAAYDVYLRDLGSYYLGLTQPEEIILGPVDKATSFLIMDNDYRGYQGYSPDEWVKMMSVTAAHEFFHAVQFGIDIYEYYESADDQAADIWWHEMTSTWMEDEVFDDVNDYIAYLPAFFEHPNWALTTQGSGGHKGLYPYAAAVWPKFLSERFDEQLIHDIWMQCGQKPFLNSIEAFHDQIAARGSSFPMELGRFRLWCYFSGSRWRPFSFSEGAHYPTIPDSTFLTVHTSYPVSDSISPLRRPEYLGTAYLQFVRPAIDSAMDFKLQVLSDKLDLWAVDGAGMSGVAEPNLLGIRDITQPLVVPSWQNYENVMVMVMPYSENYSDFKSIPGQKFLYVVSDTLKPVVDNKVLPVYPNPFTVGDEPLYISVQREKREETEIFFYTANGEYIRGGRQERSGDQTPYYLAKDEGSVGATFTWDGRNAANQKVASGVYLCLVRLGGRKSIQKVAVFRQ